MTPFTPSFFNFFEQLEKNNNKDFFDKHRSTYEAQVKQPFKCLVIHLIAELAKTDPEILREAHQCIFRINRDIRFAKDKSPYKNHLGAVFNRNGTKDRMPGFYLHLGAKEIFVGGGMYDLNKEQLAKVRQEIYYNADVFQKLISEKKFKTTYGSVKGERNKLLPEDYKEFAKMQPLIANKQFYYMTELTRADILSNNFDKIILKNFAAAQPFNQFLCDAING